MDGYCPTPVYTESAEHYLFKITGVSIVVNTLDEGPEGSKR